MLKFIKHNLETIIGIEIFPIVSFLIFFIFFIGLFVWVFRMKKSEVAAIAHLPLDQDTTTAKITDHEN
jgi:cbb3-type cytochrome oxidase subunit 3